MAQKKTEHTCRLPKQTHIPADVRALGGSGGLIAEAIVNNNRRRISDANRSK